MNLIAIEDNSHSTLEMFIMIRVIRIMIQLSYMLIYASCEQVPISVAFPPTVMVKRRIATFWRGCLAKTPSPPPSMWEPRTSTWHNFLTLNFIYKSVFSREARNPKKAIAIFTTRSSKGSGNMGSEVPKDVLVDGEKVNQRPEGSDVSTWRMSSLQTSNQQTCKQCDHHQSWLKCCSAVALRAEQGPCEPSKGFVSKSGEKERESQRESERARQSQRKLERVRENFCHSLWLSG